MLNSSPCGISWPGVLLELFLSIGEDKCLLCLRMDRGKNSLEMPAAQGMGEPLNNYEAVRAAVGMMVDSRLFGLRRSKVTVSTVGIVPRILQARRSLRQMCPQLLPAPILCAPRFWRVTAPLQPCGSVQGARDRQSRKDFFKVP